MGYLDRTTQIPHPTTPAFTTLARELSVPLSDPPTVGQQLAVARLARGVTQLDLLVAAGRALRNATVADIEAGRELNPKIQLIESFARALDVEIVLNPKKSP